MTIVPSQLLQDIRKSNLFQERMNLMQNFFLVSYFKKNKNRDYYIKFVQSIMAVYESGNMQFNNSEIAEKMFVTSKTINRYFLQTIGVAPKHYFSIMRARNALTAYVANMKLFNPSDYRYYDMSHFYKEVVKFTGQKLIEFRC